jgi:3-deoxy-D-manno-octulosonate 8-phosphate phosphatase (KDO 8-P phosphatase)
MTTTNFKERLNNIQCFVFDIDGVLTDGDLHVLLDGTMLRQMNIKDGYALQLANKKGYKIFVISGSNAEGAKKRLENLGITEVHLNVKNKLLLLDNLLIQHRVTYDHILYMGDDMPDIEVMKKCGAPTCPADAVHQVKKESIYVSEKNGGRGCVRDVIEQVLTLHNKWE